MSSYSQFRFAKGIKVKKDFSSVRANENGEAERGCCFQVWWSRFNWTATIVVVGVVVRDTFTRCTLFADRARCSVAFQHITPSVGYEYVLLPSRGGEHYFFCFYIAAAAALSLSLSRTHICDVALFSLLRFLRRIEKKRRRIRAAKYWRHNASVVLFAKWSLCGYSPHSWWVSNSVLGTPPPRRLVLLIRLASSRLVVLVVVLVIIIAL